MSATTFLRHRRGVAAKFIAAVAGRTKAGKAVVADAMERYGLDPADFTALEKNNDSLKIADEIAAAALGEDELDSLEEIGAIEVGDRAAVHAPDVRAEQFEDKLQHPCAETVGVGNMHDGPNAAADLANPDPDLVAEAEGNLAVAAEAQIERDNEDALANHGSLPAGAPSMDPAAGQITAEDDQKPTDPEGTQEGIAATPVDKESAVEVLKEQNAEGEKAEAIAEAAIDTMDRDQLIAYAATNGLDLGEIKERTTVPTIRKRVTDALAARNTEGNANV